MSKLFNRAKMTTATTGTGNLTLGSAASGFVTFATAGVVNGDVVRYCIEAENGTDFEIGEGTYTASGTVLSRADADVQLSSNSNNRITLAAGTHNVFITAADSDFTQEIIVTVANAGAGNKYVIDGTSQQIITLLPSITYRLDQSDSTNAGHPLVLASGSADGSTYSTGVRVVGTPGSKSSYTEVKLEQDAPALWYKCSNHAGMGNSINTGAPSGGTTTHANVSAMTSASPSPAAGSLHYTTATNSLYAKTSSGFFKLATINTSPSFTSVSQTTDGSTSTIAANGNLELVSGQNTVITLTGSDAESGSGQTLAYSAATTTGTQADVLASMTQGTGGSINVFTLVPAASGSAGGTISVTFSITDSIDTAQQIASFTLSLIVLNSRYTSLLLSASAAGTNAAFTDSSGSNRTVTVTGNPAQGSFSPYRASALSQNTDLLPYVASTDGGSVSATTAGNYIASTITALGTADFTIECWIYVRSAASYNPILDTREGTGGSQTGIVLGYNGSRQLYVYSGAFIIAASSSSAFSLNTWTHIVLERKSTVMKTAVNGTFGSTSNDTRNLSNTAIQILNDGAADFHDGHIADFKVTSGSNVYNHTNFTPATSFASSSGSNLHLKFTGGKVFDKSQNANLSLIGNAIGSTAQTKFAAASLALDGTGDYSVSTDSANYNFGTGDITLEAWVYWTGSGSDVILDTRSTTSASDGIMLRTNASGYLEMYSGSSRIADNTALTANAWVFVQMTRASNVSKLYKNSVQVGNNYSDSVNYSHDGCVVGADVGGGSGWAGFLSDVRVTKGLARTASTPTSALKG